LQGWEKNKGSYRLRKKKRTGRKGSETLSKVRSVRCPKGTGKQKSNKKGKTKRPGGKKKPREQGRRCDNGRLAAERPRQWGQGPKIVTEKARKICGQSVRQGVGRRDDLLRGLNIFRVVSKKNNVKAGKGRRGDQEKHQGEHAKTE